MTVDFLVIGAQKSGTTSLYHYLDEHPEIFLPRIKELRYFSNESKSEDAAAINSEKIFTLQEYLTYFPESPTKKVRGEVSPSYLYYGDSAKNIYSAFPNIKLICILRNPVDRAYSEYLHHWKMGRRVESTFLEYIKKEKINSPANIFEIHDAIRRGLYYRQLKKYLDYFPRGNICVLLHDELVNVPDHVYKKVCNFLEIDPSFMPNMNIKYNKAKVPPGRLVRTVIEIIEKIIDKRDIDEKSKRYFRQRLRSRLSWTSTYRIEKNIRKELINLFLEDIEQLESLLDKDLSSWKI